MKLSFPSLINCPNRAYYSSYCCPTKLAFEMVNADIVIDDTLGYLAGAIFFVKINDKLALIDLNDYYDECSWTYNKEGFHRTGKFYDYEQLNVPIFKRTMITTEKYPDNVYAYGPFLPVNSIDEYKKYLELKNIPVNSEPNKILHTNRLYAAATITRKKAFDNINLKKLLPEVSFDRQRLAKIPHLFRLKNCLASLEIGACPHAQGSGAIEAFMAGVPVISNDMDIMLPYNKKIERNKHYIFVEDDYNNINEAINFVYSNRSEALERAEAIYELFLNTWHPEPLTKWMEQVVEEYYA